MQADDVKVLLQDAMIKDPSFVEKPVCGSKSDIVNKGLTAAGASLLASEIILGGDGVESTDDDKVSTRGGLAGVGDGSEQGFGNQGRIKRDDSNRG